MIYKKSQENIEKDTEEVIEITKQRNHLFLEGLYENRDSVLTYFCLTCDKVISTTFYNYKRSKIGCKTCANAQVSAKLKGRVFTFETLERMREANSKRPNRGGKPRDWRETYEYRSWRKKVYEDWGNKCAITGEPMTEKLTHVVHHLLSAKSNEPLIYCPLNGILIKKELHERFHQQFTFYNNTIEQFQEFITSLITNMPISSQALSEGKEGSETKAYDPDRIMKLHERLGVISTELKKLLNDD